MSKNTIGIAIKDKLIKLYTAEAQLALLVISINEGHCTTPKYSDGFVNAVNAVLSPAGRGYNFFQRWTPKTTKKFTFDSVVTNRNYPDALVSEYRHLANKIRRRYSRTAMDLTQLCYIDKAGNLQLVKG